MGPARWHCSWLGAAHRASPAPRRPGPGVAEGPVGASSALFDTLVAGSRVSVPVNVPASATFLFAPKSSSVIFNPASSDFIADTLGDFVLPISAPWEHSTASLCDDASPSTSSNTTALRWAAWNFSAPPTTAGVIFTDEFSHGGVTSSETRFELWSGAGGSPPPPCATENATAGTLELLAPPGGSCGVVTRSALLNPFSEPISVSLSGVAPPASGDDGLFFASLVDAYLGVAGLQLEIGAESYVLTAIGSRGSSGRHVLASGPTKDVCGGGATDARQFDVALAADAFLVNVSIVCSSGEGSPLVVSGIKHGLWYAAFGTGASGAMRLALSVSRAAEGPAVTVHGVTALSLSSAAAPAFETAPLAGRGGFARVRLGASQPRALMGVIDVTAQPFNADASGATVSTRALQDALDFCYLQSCVAFLPVGTYVVDDTVMLTQVHILAMEGVIKEAGALHRYWNYNVHGEVIGPAAATRGAVAAGQPVRATIVLAPHTAGFTDPAVPKPVIWSVALDAAGADQPSINYVRSGVRVGMRGSPLRLFQSPTLARLPIAM